MSQEQSQETTEIQETANKLKNLQINDNNIIAESCPTTQSVLINPQNIVYNSIFGMDTLRLIVYNEINGTQYEIMYTKQNKNQLYFSEIEQRIIPDIIKQMPLYRPHNTRGIHFVISNVHKNTIHILNEENKYKDCHLHMCCVICITV